MNERKTLLRRLAVLVLFYCFIFALVGCSNQVAGTYVSEKNDKNYIELKADGTFFNKEGAMSVHGNYEIEGTVITLKLEGGRASRGKIEKNILTDPDGDKWIKK